MTAELRGCGIDNRYLQSDTHRGSKCLFSSPRVYGKDRGVSSPLWSSFNHTLIAVRKGGGLGRPRSRGAGKWRVDQEEKVGTTQPQRLKFLSVQD